MTIQRAPVVSFVLLGLPLIGLMSGCPTVAAPIPAAQLPGSWVGMKEVSNAFSRMELYSDGTGLFCDGTFLYGITRWTTGKEGPWGGAYGFHAVLEPISRYREPGEISGTVGPTGISYKASWPTMGSERGFMNREEDVARLRELMAPYSRASSQPSDAP